MEPVTPKRTQTFLLKQKRVTHERAHLSCPLRHAGLYIESVLKLVQAGLSSTSSFISTT